jgi:hypothetical protein
MGWIHTKNLILPRVSDLPVYLEAKRKQLEMNISYQLDALANTVDFPKRSLSRASSAQLTLVTCTDRDPDMNYHNTREHL